jgi:hypothetical protein
MAKKHKIRLRLFKMFKNCFHCSAPLIIEDKGNPNNPNIATLENKYSTWEAARHRQSHDEFRWRLVCLKCSRSRSENDIKTVPTQILWDLSGAYPLGHPKAKDYKKLISDKNPERSIATEAQ